MIRHQFSDAANLQELRYREEIQPTEETFVDVEKTLEVIRSGGYLELLPFMMRSGFVPRGQGLEIGAGYCWLTAELSQVPDVEKVHALDFSETLLSRRAPIVIRELGGRAERIQMHLGDFHDLSMFGSETLDFVAAHAALHHTNQLERVLGEVYRVLKPGGLAFALDEPGVPRYIVPFNKDLSPQHFGAHERSLGVIENTYLESEWADLFREAGFSVRFLPFFFRRKTRLARLIRGTPLVYLNGLFFWDKIIVALRLP
jgi:ubiquinone/menaquinone biosynthesis C-methylase UbiE